LDMIPLLEG